jgi:nitric oxide dioxygenase
LVSNYLHDHIQAGDTLEIGPPCGEFTLNPAGVGNRPIVLLSGGIGLTPVLSMLTALAHQNAKTPVYFIHGARNSSVHAFANEVRDIAERHPNIHAHFRYDAPLADDILEQRCDSTGPVDIGLLLELLPNKHARFYFCGPKPFMVGLYQGLKNWGVEDTDICFEFFGPRQAITGASSTSIYDDRLALAS